jgi:hypothetical protein
MILYWVELKTNDCQVELVETGLRQAQADKLKDSG